MVLRLVVIRVKICPKVWTTRKSDEIEGPVVSHLLKLQVQNQEKTLWAQRVCIFLLKKSHDLITNLVLEKK